MKFTLVHFMTKPPAASEDAGEVILDRFEAADANLWTI